MRIAYLARDVKLSGALSERLKLARLVKYLAEVRVKCSLSKNQTFITFLIE